MKLIGLIAFAAFALSAGYWTLLTVDRYAHAVLTANSEPCVLRKAGDACTIDETGAHPAERAR